MDTTENKIKELSELFINDGDFNEYLKKTPLRFNNDCPEYIDVENEMTIDFLKNSNY